MSEIYCPICEKWIIAHNKEAIANGDPICFIYVHENKLHTDDDIEALESGVQ